MRRLEFGSYAVVHDLRRPLAVEVGFGMALQPASLVGRGRVWKLFTLIGHLICAWFFRGNAKNRALTKRRANTSSFILPSRIISSMNSRKCSGFREEVLEVPLGIRWPPWT